MLAPTGPVSAAELEAVTGWELKAEGACRGDLCVPLPEGSVTAAEVDVAVVAARLGMAVVDDPSGLRALGPASLGARALSTAVAPELTLPTIDGDTWRLSSSRGQKVLIVSWAPY